MRLVPHTPATALLNASLIFGPLAFLFLDMTYSVRGWWDAPTGLVHILAAAAYGVTALRLVTLARGGLQALLLVVAVLGVVGNAGVGDDTMHVGLGGNDLFREDAAVAHLWSLVGFFFPLTLLIAAVALWPLVPRWIPVLVAIGAVVFPVAHVWNVSWLAILDALVMVVALGGVFARRAELDGMPSDAEPHTSLRV